MPENRSYTVKKLPVGSGMLKKAADALTSRKKKLDDEIEKASGGSKKK